MEDLVVPEDALFSEELVAALEPVAASGGTQLALVIAGCLPDQFTLHALGEVWKVTVERLRH